MFYLLDIALKAMFYLLNIALKAMFFVLNIALKSMFYLLIVIYVTRAVHCISFTRVYRSVYILLVTNTTQELWRCMSKGSRYILLY